MEEHLLLRLVNQHQEVFDLAMVVVADFRQGYLSFLILSVLLLVVYSIDLS